VTAKLLKNIFVEQCEKGIYEGHFEMKCKIYPRSAFHDLNAKKEMKKNSLSSQGALSDNRRNVMKSSTDLCDE